MLVKDINANKMRRDEINLIDLEKIMSQKLKIEKVKILAK